MIEVAKEVEEAGMRQGGCVMPLTCNLVEMVSCIDGSSPGALIFSYSAILRLDVHLGTRR